MSITFAEWNAFIDTTNKISHSTSHNIIWHGVSAFTDREKQTVSFGYGHGQEWIIFQQRHNCVLRLAKSTNQDEDFCLGDISTHRGVEATVPTYFVKELLNAAIAFVGVPEDWERRGLIRASWYAPIPVMAEAAKDDDDGGDIPF